MSGSKRRIVIISTTLAGVLVGGSLAVAYWTTTGTGTGSGTVGTDTPVTVTQDSTVSGLVPGGSAAPLDFTVSSTASGPQTINGVSISISGVTKAAGAPAGSCGAADFAVVDPTLGGSVVIPGNDSVTFTSGANGDVANTGATVSMVNSGSNQDGCKGATLEFTYTVS